MSDKIQEELWLWRDDDLSAPTDKVLVEVEYLDGLRDEIERLRAELAEKDRRIEELEREVERQHYVRMREMTARGGHRITHDQIDAVWARRAKYLKDAEVFQFVTLGAKAIEETLKEFNIHACKECGGSGKKLSRSSSMREEPMEWRCPVCGGHGWKIGGDE